METLLTKLNDSIFKFKLLSTLHETLSNQKGCIATEAPMIQVMMNES